MPPSIKGDTRTSTAPGVPHPGRRAPAHKFNLHGATTRHLDWEYGKRVGLRNADGRPAPPTDARLKRAFLSTPRRPNMTIAIIAAFGSAMNSRLGISTLQSLCADPKVRCAIYPDPRYKPGSLAVKRMDHVPIHPKETIMPELEVPQNCCAGGTQTAQRQVVGTARKWPKTAVHDQSGKSSADAYFCSLHARRTLRPQQRFIHALAHAASKYPADWVMLVDDDALVNFAVLRRLLGRLDHTQPLYLGDFHRYTHTRSSPRTPASWNAPWACGGSGSVFSLAAVQRMQLLECARRFSGVCVQSDWLLGVCAAEAHVLPMLSLSCGTCGLNCHHDSAAEIVRYAINASQRGDCAFAQITHTEPCPGASKLGQVDILQRGGPVLLRAGSMAGGSLAIGHGKVVSDNSKASEAPSGLRPALLLTNGLPKGGRTSLHRRGTGRA
jgi:hypothetical protein